VLLALKLLLVPVLIGFLTVAGRRWGPLVAGVLASLPVVAGPALLFLSIEQGPGFAAQAALGTLVALAAVAGSAVAYARVSQRGRWWLALPASWACFVVLTLALQAAHLPALPALAVALASFAVSRRLLPPVRAVRRTTPPTPWDLPLRMLAAMVLVFLVTALAGRLGPALTGAFTPFPVALTVLLAFIHAREGAPVAVQFLHGFLPGMWSFAAFCFVAAALLPLGTLAGFGLALGTQVALQTGLLWWMRARGAARA
jgi:hypothetical protein